MSSNDPASRIARLEQAIRLQRAARPKPSELPSRPEGTKPHLGEMQRSLWLTHQIEPDSAAYNLTSAFRTHGALDASRLQHALDTVVSRHRILRSTFVQQRDTVEQVVHAHSAVAIEVLQARESNGLMLAVNEARKPFDLETGPLIRLLLIKESTKSESLLLLVIHHILTDERSLTLLWQELADAYEGQSADAEPRVQYDDFVHWHELLDKKDRDDQLEAWRQRLSPLPDDLSLPFEKPATAAGPVRGRLLQRTLSPAAREAVHRLAAATGASPFMVFAFAFQLLLQRYTPGQRCAFATPVSTRSHPQTASMVGYFLNPVVVTAQVDEEQPVDRGIRDFSSELRQILAQASVPFGELTEVLSPPRQRDRHPIFQAMFVHQQTEPSPSLGDLQLEPVVLDLGVSKFDLTLFVKEDERSLETALEYRTDRYDEVWMRQLLEHFGTLVENLPSDLQRTLSEVPMLSPLELEKLHGNATGDTLIDSEMDLLPRQFLRHARRAPQSPALVCGETRRSYGEVEESAQSIAHELVGRGVELGDHVGVFLRRSVQMTEAVLGCHLAAAAYVPLDPDYPTARNAYVLKDADVKVVITGAALHGQLPEGDWSTIDLDRREPPVRNTAELPEVRPETPAYVLYTSGSTGHPKGVVVAHGNLRASTTARLQFYDTPPRRFLLLPSLAFDSSVAGLFWTLGVGGTLIIPTDDEAKDARRLAQLLAHAGVTSLLCVPSLYSQLLRAGEGQMQDLDTAIVAGESCPSQLAEQHFRCLPQTRLYNEYGPTEATVWATVEELKSDDAQRPVSIGRPIPGARLDVLDDCGHPVPAGIPGHAWISGPTVAQGYWQRPELTRERFVSPIDGEMGDRRYRTGDRMRWTEDGRLLFLGRDDAQIKLRGFRIEPGEVEAALLEFFEVSAAAVVVRSLGTLAPEPSKAESGQLVAFVVGPSDQEPGEWRQHLAKRLPSHMIPSRLVSLRQLPHLPNGKIDRQQLRDMELASTDSTGKPREVFDTQTQMLISLWEGLLARPGIGPDDNFFELGGHSLLVVEMTLAIERDLEVTLRAADVFENPTVRQLTERITQQGGPDTKPYDHLFPIQPSGRKAPLIVAIPHFFTEMFAQRFRGERPVYGLRGIGLRPEGNLGRWQAMRELAEELVEEIQRRFPDSAYILAGYSFGASMAVEVARILEERGVPVQRLYLIAPMPLDLCSMGPFRLQIDGLRRPIGEISLSEALHIWLRSNHPFTRRPYQRAWRWIAIEPWRRFLCLIGRMRRRIGRPLTDPILYADVRVDRFRLHARYRPQPIHTPTVVFNAQEPATDAAATWRPYFQGSYTVIPTPDPHLGDASVEAAQQVILRHLNELEDT